MDERSRLFRESNVIIPRDDVLYRFQSIDAGTGGIEEIRRTAKMNLSHEITVDHARTSGYERLDSKPRQKTSNI